MSAKEQCTCDSSPDVAGAYHSDPACPVHYPKKRPAKRPKVLHVYRHPYAGLECNDAPEHDNYIRLNGLEYLGEYAPRGEVIRERWEVRDDTRLGARVHYYAFSLEQAQRLRAERQTAEPGGWKVFHITTRKVCR